MANSTMNQVDSRPRTLVDLEDPIAAILVDLRLEIEDALPVGAPVQIT
jgi:hypothetical protein